MYSQFIYHELEAKLSGLVEEYLHPIQHKQGLISERLSE
jgi:hypothetical protein